MSSQRRRLVKNALDAYAGWRDQCNAVEVAYAYWAAARGNELAVWYTAYSAALDREERAAERYARVMQRVRSLTSQGVLGPSTPQPALP
jgi:hypothetical protein